MESLDKKNNLARKNMVMYSANFSLRCVVRKKGAHTLRLAAAADQIN